MGFSSILYAFARISLEDTEQILNPYFKHIQPRIFPVYYMYPPRNLGYISQGYRADTSPYFRQIKHRFSLYIICISQGCTDIKPHLSQILSGSCTCLLYLFTSLYYTEISKTHSWKIQRSLTDILHIRYNIVCIPYVTDNPRPFSI